MDKISHTCDLCKVSSTIESEISAAYRRFENERIKEQRSTITVSIPVRFGIHYSISLQAGRRS